MRICCTLCVFVLPYVYLLYLMCICCTLYVFVVPYMYLFYLMCICCTLCVFVVPYVYLLYYVCIAVLTLEVSNRKVLRSATSTQVFLDFPISTSEC